MDFSFNSVKYLYDNYGVIIQDNKYVVVDRSNQITYDFESEFAQYVKFAHTWVRATNYGHSTSYPNTLNKSITEEEYIRAFDNNSRDVYNLIFLIITQGLNSFGRMYSVEVLEKELKELSSYTHSGDIVKGLYSTSNGFNSFEFWCKKAVTLYSEEQLIEMINNGISR